MSQNILILDDIGTPSVNKRATYTNFIASDDHVKVLIITSKGALTDEDQQHALAFVELESPTTNGLVEVWAERFHKEHGIDIIYTKQEDLLLRAAHLRRWLGVTTGLTPEQTLIYRDKDLMKHAAHSAGFPVPPFQKVFSPSHILSFAQTHGYPFVVKPILGSASAGVRIIHDQQDCETYLERDFFAKISDTIQDLSGDFVVEKFIPGKMFHVNGYAKNGELVYVWPFAYISTNLGFTTGKAYGNVLVPRRDPLWKRLVDATKQLLGSLPITENLMFHLELFEVDGKDGEKEFMLCEIAARRPGGSIGLLIDTAEGGNIFQEMEFRLNNGLGLRHDRDARTKLNDEGYSCGDLMVPKKIGRLEALPAAGDCLVPNVQYVPIGKVGDVYKGFDINAMNTCARFVAISTGEGGNSEDVRESLRLAHEWFEGQVVYSSI
ncbi:hypothetical protein HDV00_012826 [Rhizophlyctis rosea]|nr:hypothetical protein HDV00_012826 [Rhizophlyctis rosea]